MVEREDVEVLLEKVAGRSESAVIETPIPAPTLAALCRAWLALEDAPAVEVRECFGTPGSPYLDPDSMTSAVAQLRPGQCMRIVLDVDSP